MHTSGRYIATLLLILAALAAPSGCVYDFEPELEDIETGFIVIEGDILAGMQTVVKVGKTTALGEHVAWYQSFDAYVECEDGTSFKAATGLNEIRESDTLDIAMTDPYMLNIHVSDDYVAAYRIIDTRDIDVTKRHRLVVETYEYDYSGAAYDDMHIGIGPNLQVKTKKYASQWQEVIDSGHIDSLNYVVSDDFMSVRFEVTGGGGATPYYRWYGREAWEYTALYYAPHYFSMETMSILPYKDNRNSYFCWNYGQTSEIMLDSVEDVAENRFVCRALHTLGNAVQRVSNLYRIDLIQTALTQDAYRYWSTMKRNTYDVGGLFSPQPADYRGNIYNVDDPDELVIGYVSVVKPAVSRYYFNARNSKLLMPWRDGVEPVKVSRQDEFSAYVYQGMRPYLPHEYADDEPNLGEYDWVPIRCVDCTSQGGSKQRPKYWPNDHI